jgi:hypothetical protein
MSQVNNLLNNMSNDEISTYLANSDIEPHIIVNPDRTISVPNELKRIGVEHDNNVETVTFDCPRYWDGVDLSDKVIYIRYRRSDKNMYSYIATDILIDETDSNMFHFNWTISKNVTAVPGTIHFLICVVGQDGYEWHTELNKEAFISEGLGQCEEDEGSNDSDILSQLLDLNRVMMERAAVYVGPGEMPDWANVQIDPDGDSNAVGSGTVSILESFGAVGDGVTDDAAAITQALANSKYVVFNGTKTYAVGSTIVIPSDSHVDFRGATIVPLGNHDVIKMGSGAYVENLVVRCTDVDGWDKSAMVFYGGDRIRAINPTRINNVKLYNDVTTDDGVSNLGNGLYLYVDEPGQVVEGLAVTDFSTCGFNKGVYIKGLDPNLETESSKVAFIGANNFDKYWSYKDSYGIYIETEHALDRVTTNFFTDMNLQSDWYGGYIYGIYCNGFQNYFSGCFYDMFYLNKSDPSKAVFFGIQSNRNVIETTAGSPLEYGWVTDMGTNNRVVQRPFENTIQLPNDQNAIGMLGNQDDVLAFADKYMDCTLESLDGAPLYGSLSSLFDPNPGNILVYSDPLTGTSEKRARITINFKKAMYEIPTFILKFARKFAPSKVKVTFYGDKEVKTIYDAVDNLNSEIIISHTVSLRRVFYGDPVTNVAKIVVELGGFSCTQWADIVAVGRKEWVLERIMAVAMKSTGNTWLRKDGGELYGNLKFSENFAPVIVGDDGKKYKITVSAEGSLVPVEYTETEEEAPEVAALIPTMAPRATWYNTDLSRAEPNTITSVTFDTSYVPTGTEDASWSCDKDNGAYIMAYRIGTDVIITPTTGSEYIRLNPDSAYMFANDGTNANFASLASVTGTEILIADHQTDMNRVCAGNQVITTPISIPTGVISIAYGFQSCKSLTMPPVLPEGLQSMLTSFSGCTGLQYLPEIPSTVTNMNYAFLTCKEATKAPSVIPSKVATMEATFRNCSKIEGTIEINSTNITKYTQCFDNAGKDGNGIVLTGTNTQLAELAATNALGKVTVASA